MTGWLNARISETRAPNTFVSLVGPIAGKIKLFMRLNAKLSCKFKYDWFKFAVPPSPSEPNGSCHEIGSKSKLHSWQLEVLR